MKSKNEQWHAVTAHTKRMPFTYCRVPERRAFQLRAVSHNVLAVTNAVQSVSNRSRIQRPPAFQPDRLDEPLPMPRKAKTQVVARQGRDLVPWKSDSAFPRKIMGH